MPTQRSRAEHTYFADTDDDEFRGLRVQLQISQRTMKTILGVALQHRCEHLPLASASVVGGLWTSASRGEGSSWRGTASRLGQNKQLRMRARHSAESENSEDEATEGEGATGSAGTGSGRAATAAPAAEGAGVTNSGENAAEGAPAATTTAAENSPRRTKPPLVEAQCLMAFVRPDGRVDCIASEGIRKHSLDLRATCAITS